MTYDFRGVWDKNDTWVGPYLNSHTNLTEIFEGMDLLWRNSINPQKVTLGLGFYGRVFIASSPSCLSPGCTYESGTAAQACSKEVGVVLNSEIDQLVAQEGLQPVLHRKAAPRLFNSQAATDNGGIVTGVTEHKQCKWTSCSEGCPAGWIRMMRKDPGARTNEYMTNEAGCNGVGKQYVPSSPASSFALDPSLSWNNVSIC